MKRILMSLLMMLVSLPMAMGGTKYVKATTGTHPSGDGLTTATAFDTITAGAAAATSGDTVKVAGGTYNYEPGTIAIPAGVTIRGGYKSDFTVTSTTAFPTIVGGLGTRRVFSANTVTGWALDSVTVTSGTVGSGSKGGGLSLGNSGAASGTVSHCTFHLNRSTVSKGGGIFIGLASTLTVSDCTFTSNTTADAGAAIDLEDGILTVQRSLFAYNTINSTSTGDGAVISDRTATDQVTMTNCIFAHNGQTNAGDTHNGGVFRHNGTLAKFVNCTFDSNYTSITGENGGYLIYFTNNLLVGSYINCIFSNNHSATAATPNNQWLNSWQTNPGTPNPATWSNNLFFHNVDTATSTTLAPRLSIGGLTAMGSNGNISGDPLYVNAAAGDYHLQAGSAAIDTGLIQPSNRVDFDGRSRPQGICIEIGAYEFPATTVNAVRDWTLF
jgi:hypothetical protein